MYSQVLQIETIIISLSKIIILLYTHGHDQQTLYYLTSKLTKHYII